MSLHALIYIVPYCQQKILHCSIFILQIWFKRLWICCWGEGTGCVSRGGATGWIVWWSKHWGIFTTGCTTKHTAAATRLGIGHRTVFGPEGHSWVLDTNWTSVCNDICQSYSDEDTRCRNVSFFPFFAPNKTFGLTWVLQPFCFSFIF